MEHWPINTFDRSRIQRVIAHRQQFFDCSSFQITLFHGKPISRPPWQEFHHDGQSRRFLPQQSLSKNRKEWLSTEPFFLFNWLFSRLLFLNLFYKSLSESSLASSLSAPLYTQVLTGSHLFLLHRINTDKYHVNSSTTRDILPTYSLRQVGPK